MNLVIILLIPVDFILSLSHTSRPEGFFFIDYFPLPVSRWTDTSFQLFYKSRYIEFLMSDFEITSREHGLESFFYPLPDGCFLREDNSQVFYFNPNGGSHFVMNKSSTVRVLPLFLTGNLLKIEINSPCDDENILEKNQTSECFSLTVLNTDGQIVPSYDQVISRVEGNFNWTFEYIYGKGDQIFISISFLSEIFPENSKYLVMRLVPTSDNQLSKSMSIIGFDKRMRFIMKEFSTTSSNFQLLYLMQGPEKLLIKCYTDHIEESLQWIFEDSRFNRSKAERIAILRGSGSGAVARISTRNEFFLDKRKDPLDFELYLTEGISTRYGPNSIPFQLVKSLKIIESGVRLPPNLLDKKFIALAYGQPINQHFTFAYKDRTLYNFSISKFDFVKLYTIKIPPSTTGEWIFKGIHMDVEKSNKIDFVFSDKNHSIWINSTVELFNCSTFKVCGDCETVGAVIGCEWPEDGPRKCRNSSVKGIESSEKPFRCFNEREVIVSKGPSETNITVVIDYIAKTYEKCFFRVQNQLYPAMMTGFDGKMGTYEGVLPFQKLEFFDLLIYQVMGPPLVFTRDLREFSIVRVLRDRTSWFIISALLWLIAVICLYIRWKNAEVIEYLTTKYDKFRKKEVPPENIEMVQTEVKTRAPVTDEEEFKDKAV